MAYLLWNTEGKEHSSWKFRRFVKDLMKSTPKCFLKMRTKSITSGSTNKRFSNSIAKIEKKKENHFLKELVKAAQNSLHENLIVCKTLNELNTNIFF